MRIKKIYIALIMVILLVPTVWMFAVKTQPMVIEENRIREQRRAYKLAYTALFDNGEYCEQFTKWYDDNYGMRDLMIRVRNQIDYSVFGLTNGVYMGDEGYLVYQTTVASQKQYEELDETYFEAVFAKFAEARDMFAEKGIEFYIMLPPQKNTVFPERFENIPADYPEVTQYDYLVEALKEKFPENYVDVTDILIEGEKKAPVFFKTDFHWNNHGASAAFSVLVNKIAGETIYTLDDYGIGSYDGFQGTMLNNFSILETITERGYGAEDEVTSVRTDKQIFRNSMNLTNTEEARLGKLLIVGDSYSNYVTKYNGGVADCFSEVNFVNINDNVFDGVFTAVTKEQADYVLFENIEIAMVTYLERLERMMK